jgi:hypothetical protein
MLDADFVREVADLSNGDESYRSQAVGPRKILVTSPSGDEQTVDLPPPFRACQVESLSGIITLAKSARLTSNPEVWVGRHRITIVGSTEGRDDHFFFKLVHGDQFASFPFEAPIHSAAEKFRRTFTQPSLSKFVEALRKVEVASSEFLEHESSNSSRKRSMTATKKVMAAGEKLPETISIAMPVYESDGLYELTFVEIECSVHCDMDTLRLHITPLPDQVVPMIHQALGKVVSYLETSIGRADVPVIRGDPTPEPPPPMTVSSDLGKPNPRQGAVPFDALEPSRERLLR